MKKSRSDYPLSSLAKDLQKELLESGAYKENERNEFLLRNAVIGAEKYELFDLFYYRAYKENYKKISLNVKDTYFNKLYRYIQNLDLSDRDSILITAESLDRSTVDASLNKLLLYFQNLEEYEKCAQIKKVLDIVNF